MIILNHRGATVRAQKMFDKFWAITCGENGRGRKLAFVPLHKDFQHDVIHKDDFTEEVDLAITQKGNWLLIPGTKKEGLIVVTQWYGGFRGGIRHNIDELADEEKLEILAVGATAEGDAGRVGGENQYILNALQSCKIEYRKLGRTYGEPANRVIRIDLENRKVEEYPAEAEVDLDI